MALTMKRPVDTRFSPCFVRVNLISDSLRCHQLPVKIRVSTFIDPSRSQVVIKVMLGAHFPPDYKDVRRHSLGV